MESSPSASKNVVVIGASSGIGLASAQLFARRGHRVALCARRLERLQTETDQLTAKGHQAIAVSVDISSSSSVDEAMKVIGQRLGEVDILVNAAATFEPVGTVGDVDTESWSHSIATSLVGAYAVMHAVLPSMRRRGRGSIVAISSGLAHVPMTGFSAYCAAKAGLELLSRVAAEELRNTGVRIHILAPGVVDTPMQARLRALSPAIIGQRNHEMFRHFHQSGLLHPPAEVARAIYFLASDASTAATGVMANIDDPGFWAKVEAEDPF